MKPLFVLLRNSKLFLRISLTIKLSVSLLLLLLLSLALEMAALLPKSGFLGVSAEFAKSVPNLRRICTAAPRLAVKSEAAKTDSAKSSTESHKEQQNRDGEMTLQSQSQSDMSKKEMSKKPSRRGALSPLSSPLSTLDMLSPFTIPTWDMINRLLDDVGLFQRGRRVTPSMMWDTMENDEHFKLRIEMPGFSKDEIKICVEGESRLSIKAEHKEEKEGDEWRRSFGHFETSLSLPEHVEASQISAEYKDGVLYLTIPKKKDAPKKVVDVEVK